MLRFLYLLISACLLTPLASWGQAAAPVAVPPAINFCGLDFPVDTGCSPVSSYQLMCGNYQLTWMYLDYGMLTSFPGQFVKQLEKKHKGMERAEADYFILDVPAKGYRLTYPTETGHNYEMIAFGVVKGQPVMVQLTLANDPGTDLPAVVSKILRVAKE